MKRQRLERQRQKEEIDKEKEFLQRMKEAEYYREWEKQEDSFHYNQVRLRSKIRIADGRAKPIDLLAHYINEDDDDLAVEMHEPSTYLNGLTIRDLEDLLADIGVYTQLEQQQTSTGKSHHFDEEYWKDITTITQDELDKLRKLSSQFSIIDHRREGINAVLHQDVLQTFKNKSPNQLEQLQQRIRWKIENERGIDVAFWECLLCQLQSHMARARLHERHQLTLKRKLQQIKQEQGFLTLKSTLHNTSNAEQQTEEEEEEEEEDLQGKCLQNYEQGRYSPILFNINELDLEIQKRCTDENDDFDKLKQQRYSVINSGTVKPDVEDAFEAFARTIGTLTDEDTNVNTALPINLQYLWSDKYRPRKPRVFNKVHTVNYNRSSSLSFLTV